MDKKRFPALPESEFTEDQRALAQRISGFSLNPSSALKGPFGFIARAPRLGHIFLDLAEYLRFSTGIDDRYLELAVLTHAKAWNDPYEWSAHYHRAISKGLAPEIVEAIRTGAEPPFTDHVEEAVYRFTRQLVERREVDDDTFEAIRTAFGEAGVVNLTVFIGNYAMVSDVIAVSQCEPGDTGAPPMEPPRAMPAQP